MNPTNAQTARERYDSLGRALDQHDCLGNVISSLRVCNYCRPWYAERAHLSTVWGTQWTHDTAGQQSTSPAATEPTDIDPTIYGLLDAEIAAYTDEELARARTSACAIGADNQDITPIWQDLCETEIILRARAEHEAWLALVDAAAAEEAEPEFIELGWGSAYVEPLPAALAVEAYQARTLGHPGTDYATPADHARWDAARRLPFSATAYSL